MSKKAMLWTRVDSKIKQLVQKLAETQGLTISEYIRQLVILDLDRRNIFASKLRRQGRLQGDGAV